MRYLVDTHTLIWTIYEPKRLSKVVRNLFLQKDVAFLVSAISFWEVAIKYSIGKIILENTAPEDLPQITKDAGFQVLSLSEDLLSSSHKLDFVDGHKDPFDRLIIWQAIQSGLPLISKDSDFKPYEEQGLKLVW